MFKSTTKGKKSTTRGQSTRSQSTWSQTTTRSQSTRSQSTRGQTKKKGIKTLINAGVKTIVQPGGSIRDKEVIDVANKANVKMIFTGIRHFNH